MNRIRRSWVWMILVAAVGGGGVWAVSRPAARPSRSEDRRPEAPTVSLGKVIRDGIQVECRIIPLAPGAAPAGTLREGQDVRFEFAIRDTAGGTPLAKVGPAAWMVLRPDGAPPPAPQDAVREAEAMINGSLFTPPELDLNVFYVLTLNHDATITVVDPLFGFGGTKLLALVPLAAPGADWALGPGGTRLFVALTEANQVAVVDTRTWTVSASVPGGVRPRRLAVQPDGQYLWVAGGSPVSDDSGVTVLTTAEAKVAARIRTGRGDHDLAFSDDSRFAFVTNADDGTVTILSVAGLRAEATIRTGRRPASIAYSPRARLAYVADEVDGTISSIDAEGRRVVNRIAAGPGLGSIRFTPDGRAGFAVLPARNSVCVVDPTSNRIVQTTRVGEGPDQVTFTDRYAYVRHRGSVEVVMIDLETAGRDGVPLSVARFPAGEQPPGAMDEPTPAPSIVPAPGSGAVLVANPRDRSVYFYKEGLAAPMGTFSNYKREPRAVLVLDRSLGERTRPGVYETSARLGRPGRYDLVFFLDQPRIIHAFRVEVRPDPALELGRNRGQVDIQPLVVRPQVAAGKPIRPLFQLTDRLSGDLKAGLPDVSLLMYRTGGGWQDRRPAREIAAGIYGADFVPGPPGVYHVCIACDSIGLAVNNPRPLTLFVTGPDAPAPLEAPETQGNDPR